MEEERLFPIDIHYNKLLGEGSASNLSWIFVSYYNFLYNIHAHVMRMFTHMIALCITWACMQIQHQGPGVVTYMYMFVTGIKIFDQTIYVFPSKVLDRLIYSGSKNKLAFNITDRVDRFLRVQRSPLSFHQLLNKMLITWFYFDPDCKCFNGRLKVTIYLLMICMKNATLYISGDMLRSHPSHAHRLVARPQALWLQVALTGEGNPGACCPGSENPPQHWTAGKDHTDRESYVIWH